MTVTNAIVEMYYLGLSRATSSITAGCVGFFFNKQKKKKSGKILTKTKESSLGFAWQLHF